MKIDIVVPQHEIDKAHMRDHPHTQAVKGLCRAEAEAWFDAQTKTPEGLRAMLKHIYLMLHCKA